MDDLIRRARTFATEAHRRIGHQRKYTQQPYDVHLRSVAERVASVTEDAEMIAAAWLHDVVEDTPATVGEIADPLRSFDEGQASDAVARILRDHGQDVAGVRRDGLSVGYLRQDDLDTGDCRKYRRDFRKEQVIAGDAPLSDVIDVLTRRDFCFVTSMGDVAAVIDRGCVEKPLARMWLFGIVTLTEMDIGNRIRSTWPDGEWVGYLSAGRRKKAQDFLEERRRRGQHLDLLDCLQLSDKGQILMRDPEQREAFGLTSTEQAKKAIKELVSLRDNLAHASDIVTHDWPQIARMARRIEDLATGTA